MTKPRIKFLDYDTRRNPRTDLYCVCCQRDIAPESDYRLVYVGEGMGVIHPTHVARYLAEPHSSIDFGPFPIGATCAKKLGLEWSISKDTKPIPLQSPAGESKGPTDER